ncbi:uncharacterized protein LOC127251150 [Andrographis paniculata]|uniref:uncharacterized protein LOC127251150 n=1 Tax=Andrographis paniculata TaxID=175694 RepID=UPI0021E75EBF|nr:uncharacterized protein LOC127251150 [Andrographis paniculata]
MNGGGGGGGIGGSPFNPANSTPNFDNLLLQSLMSRLQLQPPNRRVPPEFSDAKSLEDLFSDLLLNLSESESDSDSENENSSSSKNRLAKEESRVEKEIVRAVLGGEIEKLKPNSGQTISIGEHHICVGFQEETGSDYRVWEWHGHIMLFDEENGFAPEYIYGNYFERIGAARRASKAPATATNSDDKETSGGNLGLKDLVDAADSGSDRILHRSLNANSARSKFM